MSFPERAKSSTMHMPFSFSHQIRSFAEFKDFLIKYNRELTAQRAYEQALTDGRNEFSISGYCSGCAKVVPLKVDLKWGNGVTPNWRERLECDCGLNNRIRASLDFINILAPSTDCTTIYSTEQVTSLFAQLSKRYHGIIGSEYLRDGTPPGFTNQAGIRHEDITALTFNTGQFDLVLSFDVLEHVPDYRTALKEIARVLRPGGQFLASFPFSVTEPETIVRATVSQDGTIQHHLPPEFHGDPVNDGGCLCFQVFGWDVLKTMRESGFSDAYVMTYWSADKAYLGPHQLAVIGIR